MTAIAASRSSQVLSSVDVQNKLNAYIKHSLSLTHCVEWYRLLDANNRTLVDKVIVQSQDFSQSTCIQLFKKTLALDAQYESSLKKTQEHAAKNAELQQTNRGLETRVTVLEASNQEKSERCTQLENDCRDIRERDEALQAQISALEARCREFPARLQGAQTQVNTTRATLEDVQSQLPIELQRYNEATARLEETKNQWCTIQ